MTTTTEESQFHIIALDVENFLGIVAVELVPDGTLQIVSGKNGAGKSSLLDSIVHTLAGGRRVSPPKLPIRTGAKRGRVVVVLADQHNKPVFRVTRTWSEAGDKLSVHSADGVADFTSPRALLDKLVGELSFDPGAFARMTEREQAATLRKLVPALDLAELDGREDALRTERRAIGRERDLLQGQLAGIEVPPAPTEPCPEAFDGAALLEKKRGIARLRAAGLQAAKEIEQWERRAADLQQEIAGIERQLEAKRKLWIEATNGAQALREAPARQPLEELDQQLAAIDEELAAASQRHKAVDAWSAANLRHEGAAAQHKKKQAELEARATAYDNATKAIDALVEEKRARLAAAELPLPGMTLQGDVVMVAGVPFAQLSSAQQLRVGLEMGARLNPALRVVTMKDGSLLDAEGLAFVSSWAREHQMQVFLERVAAGAPVGVVIEEGRIAGAPVVEEAPPAGGVA